MTRTTSATRCCMMTARRSGWPCSASAFAGSLPGLWAQVCMPVHAPCICRYHILINIADSCIVHLTFHNCPKCETLTVRCAFGAPGATAQLASAMRQLGAVNALPDAPAPQSAAQSAAALPNQATAAPADAQPLPAGVAASQQPPGLSGVLGLPCQGSAAQPPAACLGAAKAPRGDAAVGWKVTVPFEGVYLAQLVSLMVCHVRESGCCLLQMLPIRLRATEPDTLDNLLAFSCSSHPELGFHRSIACPHAQQICSCNCGLWKIFPSLIDSHGY